MNEFFIAVYGFSIITIIVFRMSSPSSMFFLFLSFLKIYPSAVYLFSLKSKNPVGTQKVVAAVPLVIKKKLKKIED